MSSKALEFVSGKQSAAADCPSDSSNSLVSCAYDLASAPGSLAAIKSSESAQQALKSFQLDGENVRNGTIATASTGLAFALGGAGYRSAAITGEKVVAAVSEVPMQIISTMLGGNPNRVSELTYKILDEPYAPRVMRTAMKAGGYGLLAGAVGYGAYELYQYSKSI